MGTAFALALLVANGAQNPFLPPAFHLPNPLPYPFARQVSPDRLFSLQPNTARRVLYLNFDGGMLIGQPGCSDSKSNCSFIVNGGTGTAQVPAFSGTPSTRDEIVAEVKAFYSPFNVEIVTTRPVDGDYSMVMVGGTPDQVMGTSGAGAAGVAPLDCGDVESQTDISFAFSQTVQNHPHAVAVTIAQESAHAYGLTHESSETEVMYPALSGLETGFQNQAYPVCNLDSTFHCQTGRACDGSNMQNSHELLIATLGIGTGATGGGFDQIAPAVAISTPHDGQQVASGFSIGFDVSDNIAVAKIDLYADEQMIGGVGAPPWTVSIPSEFFAAGHHKLKGIAYDASNNNTPSAEITVDVLPPGSQPGETGAPCSMDGDCNGGNTCATDPQTTARYCSHACMSGNTCPSGFHCAQATATDPGLCAMGGNGGCNSLPGGRPGPLSLLLFGLGAFALVIARTIRRK